VARLNGGGSSIKVQNSSRRYQRRYNEALEVFEQLRQMAPHGSNADLGIGQVYLAEREYDKAIKAMMTDFNPGGITYYWLGAAYAAKGDHEKALETMQKAFLAGFSDFAALWYFRPGR
jgi:tetratricopeptide (TPR) repeat protein